MNLNPGLSLPLSTTSLKTSSGIKTLEKISQRGSHIKMKNYETESVIIIPDHKEVDRWTLKTILKQAEISEEKFKEYL